MPSLPLKQQERPQRLSALRPKKVEEIFYMLLGQTTCPMGTWMHPEHPDTFQCQMCEFGTHECARHADNTHVTAAQHHIMSLHAYEAVLCSKTEMKALCLPLSMPFSARLLWLRMDLYPSSVMTLPAASQANLHLAIKASMCLNSWDGAPHFALGAQQPEKSIPVLAKVICSKVTTEHCTKVYR